MVCNRCKDDFSCHHSSMLTNYYYSTSPLSYHLHTKHLRKISDFPEKKNKTVITLETACEILRQKLQKIVRHEAVWHYVNVIDWLID